MTEETPAQRNKRLRHLARTTEELARRNRRRIERLVLAASDEEIMKAAEPALKRFRGGHSFVSRWVGCYRGAYRYEVRRSDVARLVQAGRLRYGNDCRSFVVPA